MRLQEQIDEQLLDRGLVMADLVVAGRLRPAQFQPIERRFAGDRRAILAPRLKLARQNRHHRVVSQRVVVAQVLITQCDAEHPLTDQRLDLVLDQVSRPHIPETRREPIDQPDRTIRRAQKQPTSVRCDRPAVKRSHDSAPFNACKSKQIRATLCRHRGTPLKLVKWFW